MTKNFTFCNEVFLNSFCYKPEPFYNQFLLKNETKNTIDSMGDHPDCHIVFKYDTLKRIRATFIVFDDDLREMDVACICTLFHGDRGESYCYFYEVYEDLSIGCIQVAHGFDTNRIVKELNVGDDIDTYFNKLCASFSMPICESTTTIYYKEEDDCFRLLDIIPSELPERCVPLLGGEPIVERKTINGINYLFYKSRSDNSCLVARTADNQDTISSLIDDFFCLEFELIKERNQAKIKSLYDELYEFNYMHTFFNLRQAYDQYISELDDLFYRHDYIAPYEMYQFFYQVSFSKYNFLFDYAKYVEDSGNLPGAFLREAIGDLELWSINTLLRLEQTNAYKKENPNTQLLSIQGYDAVLETQKQHCNLMGYALNDRKVSEAYAWAANEILEYLGTDAADKAHDYYQTAFELLESSSADSEYNSGVYYTYYTTLYNFLLKYKSDIEKYGVKCDFDIDQKIYDCMHKNYRQAQSCSRDTMIVQVNNLIANGCCLEAISLAKEIIDICEERVKNIQVRGTKLSLKNAYELLLSVPNLPEEEKSTFYNKLQNLLSVMTHEDYFCKDGDKEYPIRAY